MVEISRRSVLKFGLLGGAAYIATQHGVVNAFSQSQTSTFEFVSNRAKQLADAAYVENAVPLPPVFQNMEFDKYRNIRFRSDKSLLKDTGAFRVQLLHRGFLYDKPVGVNVVCNSEVLTVPYAADNFDFGQLNAPTNLPNDFGFSGLRVQYPLNDPRILDELIVFQGASYFRILSRGQRFGLSARGLAIDTALLSGEEFPHFKEFWVETPKVGDTSLTLIALLDSPSVSGVYEFIIRPSDLSTVDVRATIYARKAVKKLGLAPLTSMYHYGELRPRPVNEYRPEVHDSDGVLINTGSNEWIWRPLRNPKSLSVSAFMDKNTKGFGLMQRDRQFSHYQDVDLHYERRPSYWVSPKGDWGDGHVELVEIPTPDETNDNIVLLWVPKEELKPKIPFSFGFTLSAMDDGKDLHSGGKSVNVFIKPLTAAEAPEHNDANVRRIMVDFAGGDLEYYLNAPESVSAVASASAGKIIRVFVTPNPDLEGFRAIFDYKGEANLGADLRLFLKSDTKALTETWTFPVRSEFWS